jgi:HK97 family phage prohead protease
MKARLERKAVVAEFKARDEPGVFEARFSRFGNVDRYSDRVLKGAFEDVFKGDLPPVVWTHMWEIPPVGETLEAKETDVGAEAVGRLFVKGDEDHEVARQVYTAMKAGALRQFSYAYTVAEAAFVEEDGQEVREIAKFAELFEWGPTLVGVNPETELLAAPKALPRLVGALEAGGLSEDELVDTLGKAGLDVGPLVDRWIADVKAGARNSAKDLERLQMIHDLAVENGASCAGQSGATGPAPASLDPRVVEILTARPLL